MRDLQPYLKALQVHDMSSLLQVRHSQELPAARAPAVPSASEERSTERGCSEEVRCCLAGAGGVFLGICIL